MPCLEVFVCVSGRVIFAWQPALSARGGAGREMVVGVGVCNYRALDEGQFGFRSNLICLFFLFFWFFLMFG